MTVSGAAYCIRRLYGAMAYVQNRLLFVGLLDGFTKRFAQATQQTDGLGK
jgi:hypothetical protein